MNVIKLKTLFTLLAILVSVSAFAQAPQTFYYMNDVPQSTLMNPAIQPRCNFHFGLPVVSSFQIRQGNNQLALSDIIMKNPNNDSLITFLHPDADFNKADFLSKLDKNNYFYEDFRTNLLSFGFRVNTWYFAFNLSEKITTTINYPKDLLVLALEGNQGFINQSADLSYLGINSTFYREYGLLVSKEINSNLSVGVKAKVLFGHTNISSDYDVNELNLYTSRDSIYVNADLKVNTSSPLIPSTDIDGYFESFEIPSYIDNSETDSLIDWALEHKNMGLAIDAGIYYKPIDKLSLSASIIDFGYINWNTDEVTTLTVQGEYAFKGIDVSDEIGNSDSNTDQFDDLLDSLENSFKATNSSSSYRTYLGAKIYIGANYEVSKKFNVGFLSRSYIRNSNLAQAYTFSANAKAFNGLMASVSYSIMNGSYNNIGFGLVLGGAPLQIYLVSDNISAALWGHKTTSFNFRFGLNVAFGCRQKSKMKDTPLLKSVF
ncbi:MAG: hypothetical protein C0597_17160 [Marinilabiliales bacterium]|nr:MAG: hypothetical protein C0597_17160 [Marinilabiliales bacterium]